MQLNAITAIYNPTHPAPPHHHAFRSLRNQQMHTETLSVLPTAQWIVEQAKHVTIDPSGTCAGLRAVCGAICCWRGAVLPDDAFFAHRQRPPYRWSIRHLPPLLSSFSFTPGLKSAAHLLLSELASVKKDAAHGWDRGARSAFGVWLTMSAVCCRRFTLLACLLKSSCHLPDTTTTRQHSCTELHYYDGGPHTLQYLLVMDALNYCFWPGG